MFPLNFSEECVPLKRDFIVGFAMIPAVVGMENLFFLMAVIIHWKKLKESNVYRYVVSTLMANFAISALAFYHFLNYYFGFEPTDPNLWWAFRKGMQLALSLVLCGNTGLLIYGIHDVTYVVGREVAPQSLQGGMESLNPTFRRRKANVLIILVWALPTLYGLLAMTPWNCINGYCTCTLSYESGRSICIGDPCSNIYMPMAKTYLLVVTILWSLECLGLIAILVKSVYDVTQAQKQEFNSSRSLFQSFKASLSANRVSYILFFLFFCCTSPTMVLFVMDFHSSKATIDHLLVNILVPLPLIYCFVSPFLLARRLTGVQNAVLAACRCGNCSAHVKRRRRRSERKRLYSRPSSTSFATRSL